MKINESQLRKIIKESIKKVLTENNINEVSTNVLRRAADKAHDDRMHTNNYGLMRKRDRQYKTFSNELIKRDNEERNSVCPYVPESELRNLPKDTYVLMSGDGRDYYGNFRYSYSGHAGTKEQCIALDSTDADLYESRANYYGEMGNRAKAIEDLTKYIEFYPEFHYAYYRRGWYKHLDLQHEAAIEDFNLAIMLDSTYNYAYDGRGRSYYSLGKMELAKADFEKILSFDTIPNDNSCASSAYHFLGLDSLAIEYMLRTLEKDSTAYYDAACTYALAKDVENAVFYLRKAFENGFCRLHHVSVDMDFDAIRDTPEFKSLIEEYTIKIQQKWQPIEKSALGEERIVEVPFTAANGVTKVNCTINGLPLNFVFDTGASDVTISQVEANFMFKNGYLSEKDVVGKQHYQTADGNISVGTVINLNAINFGGLSLNNIRASVVQSQNAPILLGQSVLQRLGKIEIDYAKRVLKITTIY